MKRDILPLDEAQRIGLEFIQTKYYRGTVTVSETRLVTEGAFPVYYLEGNVKILSRSPMSRLFSPAAEYTFTAQVHAIEGSIVNYELR